MSGISDSQRRSKGKDIRNDARDRDYPDPFPNNRNNGEEDDAKHNRGKYRNFIANFTKALPHHPLNDAESGEVVRSAYQKLIDAANDDDPDKWEMIPLGSQTITDPRRLVNPVSGVDFDLEGLDSHATHMPPAPRIGPKERASVNDDNGAEAAGEMAELYWMALSRDVYFGDFNGDSTIQSALDDLSNNYTKFPIPKNSNLFPLSKGNIFRGFTMGDIKGPYISQFLLKGNDDVDQDQNQGYIKYGSLRIDQRQLTVLPTTPMDINDFVIDYAEWLDIQDGKKSPSDITCGNRYDTSGRRFIRNMRDLANYVHIDALPQEFVNAALILIYLGVPSVGPPAGPCAFPPPPFDKENPYIARYEKQEGFGTFGSPHILTLVAEVTTRALKAAWYHKWFVHRRLRPEEFGGLINRQLGEVPGHSFDYPINPEILRINGGSSTPTVLDRIKTKFNSYLLPQVYPEASPIHPSYPSGHATIAGACVTILKAFFKEDFEIPKPVQSNSAGNALIPATNFDGSALVEPLTVRNELDKLASNISIGRNIAGVHYRSDYTQSLFLGEQVAISVLEDQEDTYLEKYCISFHKFDGSTYRTGTDC